MHANFVRESGLGGAAWSRSRSRHRRAVTCPGSRCDLADTAPLAANPRQIHARRPDLVQTEGWACAWWQIHPLGVVLARTSLDGAGSARSSAARPGRVVIELSEVSGGPSG